MPSGKKGRNKEQLNSALNKHTDNVNYLIENRYTYIEQLKEMLNRYQNGETNQFSCVAKRMYKHFNKKMILQLDGNDIKSIKDMISLFQFPRRQKKALNDFLDCHGYTGKKPKKFIYLKSDGKDEYVNEQQEFNGVLAKVQTKGKDLTKGGNRTKKVVIPQYKKSDLSKVTSKVDNKENAKSKKKKVLIPKNKQVLNKISESNIENSKEHNNNFKLNKDSLQDFNTSNQFRRKNPRKTDEFESQNSKESDKNLKMESEETLDRRTFNESRISNNQSHTNRINLFENSNSQNDIKIVIKDLGDLDDRNLSTQMPQMQPNSFGQEFKLDGSFENKDNIFKKNDSQIPVRKNHDFTSTMRNAYGDLNTNLDNILKDLDETPSSDNTHSYHSQDILQDSTVNLNNTINNAFNNIHKNWNNILAELGKTSGGDSIHDQDFQGGVQGKTVNFNSFNSKKKVKFDSLKPMNEYLFSCKFTNSNPNSNLKEIVFSSVDSNNGYNNQWKYVEVSLEYKDHILVNYMFENVTLSPTTVNMEMFKFISCNVFKNAKKVESNQGFEAIASETGKNIITKPQGQTIPILALALKREGVQSEQDEFAEISQSESVNEQLAPVIACTSITFNNFEDDKEEVNVDIGFNDNTDYIINGDSYKCDFDYSN